jgi:hypothetical protein
MEDNHEALRAIVVRGSGGNNGDPFRRGSITVNSGPHDWGEVF